MGIIRNCKIVQFVKVIQKKILSSKTPFYNSFTFTSGLNKWSDSLKIMTDGYDRWWKWWWFRVCEHLFPKLMPIQIQAKPATRGCFSKKFSYWCVNAQDVLGYRLTVLSNIVILSDHHFQTYHVPWGGGGGQDSHRNAVLYAKLDTTLTVNHT